MLLNLPRCDYLTLTSFEEPDLLLSMLSDIYPAGHGEETKAGGYTGHQWDGLFLGVGKQRHRAHFIMRASGEGSQEILNRTRELDWNCTRLDLQITIRLPLRFSSRRLYDKLDNPETDWPGRRLKPQIVQSGDGLDTVYVGSRTSDRFVRIYVKPDQAGRPAYLRFEVEFKGTMAAAARRKILSGTDMARAILLSEVNRMPVNKSQTLTAFARHLSGTGAKVRPERVDGQNKTLDWIEQQVEPAILRLLNSHEDKRRMEKIIWRWVDNIHRDD